MPRKMKESGVEWLGQIPEGWDVLPLKGVCTCNDEVLPEDTPKNYRFDYVDIGAVKYGQGIVSKESLTFEEAPSRARRKVFTGDVIVSTVRTYLKSVALISAKEQSVVVSTGFAVLRPSIINSQFLFYLANSQYFSDMVESWSTGISYPSINAEDLLRIKLPFPSLPEQERIAAFLDERCAKIDGMIAEAKASIEDYKKWKQSIIFETVTGKHEKNLKPSGVDWIGDVPEGWKVCRIKDVAQIRTGSTPDKTFQREYYSPEVGVPWIKAENLGTIYPISNTTEFLTEQGVKEGRVFPANTVFVCCIASVGKVGYSNVEASCNQQINGLIFNALMDWKYGFYVMLGAEEEYNVRSSGNVVRILNSALQSTINIPLPQILEQCRIAAELDEKCAAIDKLVGEKEALIADLEAYKKSLIFETVTGKREVA